MGVARTAARPRCHERLGCAGVLACWRAAHGVWLTGGGCAAEDYADEALATKSASPAVPVTAVASKWDDEDADEPVKVRLCSVLCGLRQCVTAGCGAQDAWDDDDTKTSKPHAAARSALSATTPPKKKKSMAHAIAQRKEEDERRLKQLAEKKAAIEAQRQQDEDGHANETPSERRARLQKAVEAEDARNINDLFGDVSIKGVRLAQPSKSRQRMLMLRGTQTRLCKSRTTRW